MNAKKGGNGNTGHYLGQDNPPESGESISAEAHGSMLVDLVDAAEGGSKDDDYIGYCQNGVGHGYANDGADKYPHVEGVEVEKSDGSEGRGDYEG